VLTRFLQVALTNLSRLGLVQLVIRASAGKRLSSISTQGSLPPFSTCTAMTDCSDISVIF